MSERELSAFPTFISLFWTFELMRGEMEMFGSGEQKSWSKWALLPLRLIIGLGFMAHGFAKLSAGPQKFAGMLQTIGVPAPGLMAWMTALVEFFGGLAVAAGAFIPIVSIPLAIIMLVAMFTVHLPYGFSSIKLMGITGAALSLERPVTK